MLLASSSLAASAFASESYRSVGSRPSLLELLIAAPTVEALAAAYSSLSPNRQTSVAGQQPLNISPHPGIAVSLGSVSARTILL